MPENHQKLNLDRLLDLKRAEKPSSEFWDGFQKEFRQRQLQTLIEKESFWSRLPGLFFARSSVIVPLSGVAVVLFVLGINIQESSPPLQNEYFASAEVSAFVPQPSVVEPLEVQSEEIIEVAAVPDHAPVAQASFVVDVIPNQQPDSLSYTKEFPTSTIRSENRAVSALVSYTIAREGASFGMVGGPQTVGF